jgi:hypothetical protein
MMGMTKSKKLIIPTYSILATIIIVATLAFVGLVGADSPPSIPNQFYGTVKNNGIRVPAGYTVAAKAGAAQLSSTITDASGRYGYGSGFYVAVADGETIEFWVNGVKAAQTVTSSAGAALEVDLTISGASGSTTPTTTPPAANPSATTPVATTTAAATTATSSPSATGSSSTEQGASQAAASQGSQNVPGASNQPAVAPSNPSQSQVSAPVQSPVNSGNESGSGPVPVGLIAVIVSIFVVLLILIRIFVMLRKGPHNYR